MITRENSLLQRGESQEHTCAEMREHFLLCVFVCVFMETNI